VQADVHADDGLVVVGARDVVVGEDPLPGPVKVLELENPEKITRAWTDVTISKIFSPNIFFEKIGFFANY
jgi:hypothetical protein